jgi:Anti-sigma-K factor rskA
VKPWRSEAHLLTGSYALDALEPAEQHVFERHLTHCGSCVTEVRGLRETAARLSLAAAEPPPPGMQERVLDATYRTRQLPPVVQPAARPRRRITVPRLSVAVAAVAVVLVAVLAVIQIRTQHLLDTARAGNGAVAAVLSAPDASARSGQVSGGGTVTVVSSSAEGAAVIATSGMPALPGAEVYQLWVMSPAGATSAGLLSSSLDGRTNPVLASGIRLGDRIGITVEPAGGTTRPTTNPLIVMPLPT